MRTLYQDVENRLARMDFSAIYPGFHPYPFALYDHDRAWFHDKVIPRSEAFFGNTALEYGGQRIAIWQVGDVSPDADILTSGMVHEMFHAFQQDTGLIEAWPDDLTLLCYPEDAENHRLRLLENRLLAEGGPARETLETIRLLRRQRRALIGYFLTQEELVEELEGQAECCGLLALKQLSREKYFTELAKYRDILRQGDHLLDVRRNAYFSGALLHLLEREAGEDTLTRRIEAHRESKQSVLDDFFSSPREEHPMDAAICGYDPMNQFRAGDLLWAKHLIFLRSGDETIKLKGPVVLRMKPGSPREITAYYQ